MIRKGYIRLVVLFFAFAFSCQSMQPLFAAPSPAAKESSAASIVSSKGELPNAELERTHFPVVTGAHILVQKIIPSTLLPLTSSFFGGAVVLNNLQIRESSRLSKDYLFHIYPTHHFW